MFHHLQVPSSQRSFYKSVPFTEFLHQVLSPYVSIHFSVSLFALPLRYLVRALHSRDHAQSAVYSEVSVKRLPIAPHFHHVGPRSNSNPRISRGRTRRRNDRRG